MFTIRQMLISKIMTVLAFNVLIITAVRTVSINISNFLGAIDAAGFLNSASCLDFGIEDKFLKKLDNSKTNNWNQ